MKKLNLITGVFLTFGLTAIASPAENESEFAFESNGTNVKVTFFSPSIVRVEKVPQGSAANRQSLAVTKSPEKVATKTKREGDLTIYSSKELSVSIDATSGAISFLAPDNTLLLSEGKSHSTSISDGGNPSYSVAQSFSLLSDEQIYGLGILQNGKMSQRGENRTLRTGNIEDGVPFFQSDKGYGVYWDNYSPTTISDDGTLLTLTAESAPAIDYYFIYGKNADGVIANVRELTGDVPMAPLWAYGFMQSRERYKSQDELLNVLTRYRTDGVPIDCMIQDWQYWGNNYQWNAMEFMNEQFSHPQAMMDSIHALNAKCMISIWSSFGPMTKPYHQLKEKGLLFDIATWPQSGISHVWPPRMDYPSGVKVYDCYSQEARDIYWDNLKRIHKIGMDGWWMDSTEPDHFDHKPQDFDHMTAMGTYRSLVNAYPLMTVGGVYDHQRADSDSKRVFILTRSCSFGQQRYGANVWSGDVVSTWDMLRKQVPAGLNFSLTGNPNFNSDLGGFFAGSYNGSWKGKPGYENPAYRELYVRWMQQGVFTPMMRSHGTDVPRELFYYGKPGEAVYDAMVSAIKLRYSLLPYIYSTAWQVSKNRDTFMRALAMDYQNDPQAAASAQSYMFGRALLATPVLTSHFTPEVIRKDADANAGWNKDTGKTSIESLDNVDFTKSISHEVYLPSGNDWYYFHDNSLHKGGSNAHLDLTLSEVPFFVKAGSILPIGPDVQWSGEKDWDNLEIRIYPGSDADFTLYEDEGDGYAYENGQYSTIKFHWNDKQRKLTVSKCEGEYPGMLKSRNFRFVCADSDPAQAKSVAYSGNPLSIKL